MGLGKTVMSLALLADEDYEGLNLIVTPKNVTKQWSDEIEKHCGLNVAVFDYQAASTQKRRKTDLHEYNVVLITYPTLSAEYRKYKEKEDKNIKHKIK